MRKRRNVQSGATSSTAHRIHSVARLFGYLLVEIGRLRLQVNSKTEEKVFYLLRLSLALGKSCIADGDLESARSALEKAAEQVDKLPADRAEYGHTQSANQIYGIKLEYLTLRIAMVSYKSEETLTQTLTRVRVMERR